MQSSPHYAQSNGKSENAVKTLKLLFANAKQSGESEYMNQNQNKNQNRFIRSYYRHRIPLLRPYLVDVAEATWKKVYRNVCM